ncbi:response regulator transcription factor [Sporomusa sp.]|jgi:YesN/AraC family two-component response regulator|uniref:response regulator transcription factor n=1 Tax=Sporomusa sp. TaxID=2078658 RepID=UPI002C81A680|nr:response regulator [Sporomusa sp.]HWR07156.1 response regulator [Sporomusa sp.]
MYKLLIVEDVPLERKALRKIIQRQYFNINILEDAKNGIEAIEKAKLYRPDIILMDIRIPEISGLEAQKRIVKIVPNVKTIILTAYSEFDYAQEAIKNGVADYLLKPVRPEDLVKAIDLAIVSLTKAISVVGTGQSSAIVERDILKGVLNYIERHYCSEIKLNAVAEFAHLNPQYFSRYFKKEMGITFTNYVMKLRVEKAKRLLADTNYPIYRIAAELGFSDPTYFNKVFLKYEKQPPYKYKQTISK